MVTPQNTLYSRYILIFLMVFSVYVPVAVFADVDPALEAEKAAAHQIITDAFSAYAERDYYPEGWVALNDFRNVGDSAVDSALDSAEILLAHTTAIAGMESVNPDFADNRALAHTDLNTLLASYTEGFYLPGGWSSILEFKATGDAGIESAVVPTDITDAYNTTISQMASIFVDIPTAKTYALGRIASAYTQYNSLHYTSGSWNAIETFKTEGETGVNVALDAIEITTAYTTALDGMETILPDLFDVKTLAHANLDTFFNSHFPDEYTPEKYAEFVSARTTGDTTIDAMTDAVAVADAEQSARTAMLSVPTLVRMLADAKTLAHEAVGQVMATRVEADYTPENWITIMNFKNSGDVSIEGALDITEVASVQGAVIAAITGTKSVADANAEIAAAAALAAQTARTTASARRTGGGGGGGSAPVVSRTVTATAPVTGTVGRVLGASSFKFSTPIRKSVTSPAVVELQERLRSEGFFTYPVSTGYFGPATLSAVKAYQATNGLPSTGFVGPMTIALLNK